jgi:hypothetical protein
MKQTVVVPLEQMTDAEVIEQARKLEATGDPDDVEHARELWAYLASRKETGSHTAAIEMGPDSEPYARETRRMAEECTRELQKIIMSAPIAIRNGDEKQLADWVFDHTPPELQKLAGEVILRKTTQRVFDEKVATGECTRSRSATGDHIYHAVAAK